MKDLKTLTSQIEKAQAAHQRAADERRQAIETIESEGRHDEVLTQLRVQRTEALGRALVLKRKADTTKIDADIQSLEQQRAVAIEAANVARAALPIYEAGIRIAQAEVSNLLAERRAAIEAHIMASHDAAQARYLQAVADMESAVAEMVGAEAAWHTAFGSEQPEAFPARGKQILDDIRTAGVKVPWDHSRMKDSSVRAEYTDDYRDHWYIPAWAAPENQGFGDACAARLVEDIRSAGVDCSGYVGYQKPAAAKTLRVRIIRGTISGPQSVMRSAATGAIISRKSVSYIAGDEAEIEESLARKLAAAGQVVICGEESNEGGAEKAGISVMPQLQRPVGLAGPRRMQDTSPGTSTTSA